MITLDAILPERADIEYYSGSDYWLYFSVTDEDGNAVDLSSKTLVWKAKKKKNDSIDAAELTSDSEGIAVSGVGNNVVGLHMDFDLEERFYWHDLKNTTDDETIIYGKLMVIESVND